MKTRNIFVILCGVIVASILVIVILKSPAYFDTDRSSKDVDMIRKSELSKPITPFTNIAEQALVDGYVVWNDRPGVAIFDYDRDGDHDFYVTSEIGKANWLYDNRGNGQFVNVSVSAGVAATAYNNTGVVACDVNNDGYQDLYVGSWGLVGDRLDFRSHLDDIFSQDLLFLNNKDGTFSDVSLSAFGDKINFRSATSIACADVNNDGWLDIYVGNLLDDDFRFTTSGHAGHYNMFYINNTDGTFSESAFAAGVEGPEIIFRNKEGVPILFVDPVSGEKYEGYDPSVIDIQGQRVGDSTGQTHAVMFFDYDDDGDPDLWVANDGDRLHVFRNDSTTDQIKFTLNSENTEIGKAGAWMGFALGDYDSDQDLDVFVTNMGYHPRLRAPLEEANGTCEYHDQFDWGTCLHFLLKNERNENGTTSTEIAFKDVASVTIVQPNNYMPPDSLDESKLFESQLQPRGLAAYDFGFGATFFDYENDGDQDLYWLGSTIARGKGPGGSLFPSAGRMLRNDGSGRFQDITVESQLLDIVQVRYDLLGQDFDNKAINIDVNLHENGKGLAHADFNNDGYIDLVGTNSSGPTYKEYPPVHNGDVILEPGPIFLWLNGGGKNHWISFRLQGRMAVDGTGSNADGIGARMYVTTVDNQRENPLVQIQEVRAGSSYLSMDSMELEFGLGDAQTVDEVFIHWPSGRTQILNNLPADQQYLILEPPPVAQN